MEKKNPNMETMSRILERMTESARAAERRRPASRSSRKRLGDESSEWQLYHEEELWAKLKNERTDLVLMSDDHDEPRVFRRGKAAGGDATGAKVPSTTLSSGLDDQNAGRRGLAPIPLDEEYRTSLFPIVEAVKTSTSHGKRPSEYPNTTVSTGKLQALMKRRASEIAPMEVEQHSARPEEMPLKLSKQQWRDLITGPKQNHGPVKKQKETRRRIRHHRLNCRFHLYSTNPEFRRMSLAVAFPSEVLRESYSRLQHSANGGKIVRNATEVPAETYFESPLLLPNGARQRTASSSFASMGRSTTNTVESLRTSTNASPSPLPSGGGGQDGSMRVQQSGIEGVPSGDQGVFNLTEASAFPPMAQRCRTPALAPFTVPPRPHSVEGEFNDCDCTPRSTDDELSEDDEKNILSADHAAKKLSRWHRQFELTTVRGLATLHSVLKEREEQRSVTCHHRTGLEQIAVNGEAAGAGWLISRQSVNTTEKHSSIWAPAFEIIGVHEKLVATNRDLYVAICDSAAADFNIPSEPIEVDVLLLLRDRFIRCSDARPPAKVSPMRSRENSRASTPATTSLSHPHQRPDTKHGHRPPSRSAQTPTPSMGASKSNTGPDHSSRAASPSVEGMGSKRPNPFRFVFGKEFTLSDGVEGTNDNSFGLSAIGGKTLLGSTNVSRSATPTLGGVSHPPAENPLGRTPTPNSVSGVHFSRPHSAIPIVDEDGQESGRGTSPFNAMTDSSHLPIPDDGNPLTEDFFLCLLERFGKHLVSFKNGVLFLNQLRERCHCGEKIFFSTIQRKAELGEWSPHHETNSLQKRLMTARGEISLEAALGTAVGRSHNRPSRR